MKSKTWIMGVATVAMVGVLQGQLSLVKLDHNGLEAWFLDGTGVEIHTESTGSTKISSAGDDAMGLGRRGPQDVVSRVVIDSDNNILFAYDLEASRGKNLDTISIRVKPIGTAVEADILRRARVARPPNFLALIFPRLPLFVSFLP